MKKLFVLVVVLAVLSFSPVKADTRDDIFKQINELQVQLLKLQIQQLLAQVDILQRQLALRTNLPSSESSSVDSSSSSSSSSNSSSNSSEETSTEIAVGAPVEVPHLGTCSLSVSVNGTRATAKWSSSKVETNPFVDGGMGGYVYMEYRGSEGNVWSPNAILGVSANSMGTFPYLEDGKGIGLESTSVTGGLENATDFKLVFMDGTTCYNE